MDYVDTKTKRHLKDTIGGRKGERVKTACGRTVTAEATGACIAPMIDCGGCRRVLAAEMRD